MKIYYHSRKSSITYAAEGEEKLEKLDKKDLRVLKSFLVILFLSTTTLIFTPKTSEAYKIIGIGMTFDYLKNNEKVKELPDKAIDALDRWISLESEDTEAEKSKK